MCGRFTLRVDPAELIEHFGVSEVPSVTPRFNIAPSQEVFAVRNDEGERTLSYLLWGLTPSWSREPKGVINARAETLLGKPSFREPFKRRRCLIPADGFYEWKKEGRGKQPYYFRLKEGGPFAFAGLWDEWRGDGSVITSCAIITTTANELVAPYHDRMPVILSEESYDGWLRSDGKPDELQSLLTPYPASGMSAHPVSAKVNSPSVDDARLVEPASSELLS